MICQDMCISLLVIFYNKTSFERRHVYSPIKLENKRHQRDLGGMVQKTIICITCIEPLYLQ